MIVKVQQKIIGIENKVSSKTGTPYTAIAFMDGLDLVRAISRNPNTLVGVVPYTDCELTLDIKFGAYPKIEVVGCQLM